MSHKFGISDVRTACFHNGQSVLNPIQFVNLHQRNLKSLIQLEIGAGVKHWSYVSPFNLFYLDFLPKRGYVPKLLDNLWQNFKNIVNIFLGV